MVPNVKYKANRALLPIHLVTETWTALGPQHSAHDIEQCYDRGMQILVVEDERSMAELLKRTLQEEGHQVVLAGDGRQGFEIARCSAFDVIVLDVMLPGMDGI